MTDVADRLDRLEAVSTPLEIVLAWLDEAHEYRSVGAYVRATLIDDEVESPGARVLARASAASRLRHQDLADASAAIRIRTDIRDTAFLFELALTIESTARSFATEQLMGIRLSGHLLGDALDDWFFDGRLMPQHVEELLGPMLDDASSSVAALIAEVAIEQAAYDLLVDRYLEGRSPLFAHAADAWARLEGEIEVAARDLATARKERPGPDDARGNADDEPGPAETGVRAHARLIADDARMAAHRMLGDPKGARRIMLARQRP